MRWQSKATEEIEMRNRYTVRRGDTCWIVIDSQTNEPVEHCTGRDPARAAARKRNVAAWEERGEQQSRGETI